jgi:hypothetical protein
VDGQPGGGGSHYGNLSRGKLRPISAASLEAKGNVDWLEVTNGSCHCALSARSTCVCTKQVHRPCDCARLRHGQRQIRGDHLANQDELLAFIRQRNLLSKSPLDLETPHPIRFKSPRVPTPLTPKLPSGPISRISQHRAARPLLATTVGLSFWVKPSVAPPHLRLPLSRSSRIPHSRDECVRLQVMNRAFLAIFMIILTALPRRMARRATLGMTTDSTSLTAGGFN